MGRQWPAAGLRVLSVAVCAWDLLKEVTIIFITSTIVWPQVNKFPGGSDDKASAYNVGDLGSVPGLGRSPGEGNGNPLSILAWKIPWREEPGRLQSIWPQRVGH